MCAEVCPLGLAQGIILELKEEQSYCCTKETVVIWCSYALLVVSKCFPVFIF